MLCRPSCLIDYSPGERRSTLWGSEFQNPTTLGEYRDIVFGTVFGTGNTPSNGCPKHATFESRKRTFLVQLPRILPSTHFGELGQKEGPGHDSLGPPLSKLGASSISSLGLLSHSITPITEASTKLSPPRSWARMAKRFVSPRCCTSPGTSKRKDPGHASFCPRPISRPFQ